MTKHIKLVTRQELAVVKGLCYMTWNLKQLWQNWKRKKSFTENLGEIPGNQSDLFMKDLDRWTILNDPYHHNNSKSKHLTDSNFPLQMLNFLHRYGHNEWLTKTLTLTISFFRWNMASEYFLLTNLAITLLLCCLHFFQK